MTERDAPRFAFDAWHPLDGLDYAASSRFPFGNVASIAPALPPGSTWERRAPVRAATVSADVFVPVLQSATTALVGGVAAGLLSQSLAGAGVGAGLTFGASWLALLRAHRAGLWAVERVTGRDLDGDGRIGRPGEPAQPSTVKIEIKEDRRNGQSLAWLDLPVDEKRLRQFAQRVTAGGALSESEWTGSGGPFSRDEFRGLRDALIERGLARWRNPQEPRQGWELTRKGKVVLEHVAQTPLPQAAA
jgi:hypothetical protein